MNNKTNPSAGYDGTRQIFLKSSSMTELVFDMFYSIAFGRKTKRKKKYLKKFAKVIISRDHPT